MMSDEPRILAFLCNWCAYAAGDLAGVLRIQYPPNVRVIRVMCTGRVDAKFVLEAFLKGCDGIWVGGWHPGECHYQSGNVEVINMVNVVRRILEYIKINPNRLLLEWASAAEGRRFAEVVSTFTDEITELGPLGADSPKGIEEVRFRLEAAKNAVESEKLRWIAAKQTEFKRTGNNYGEIFTSHEIGRLLDEVVREEITLQEILLLLQKNPLSIMNIAQRLGLFPPEVLKRVIGLRKNGRVRISEIRGSSPLYTATNNVEAIKEKRWKEEGYW